MSPSSSLDPAAMPASFEVRWLPMQPVARLFSISGLGWYRYAAALLALALITGDSTEAWRLPAGMAAAFALLWWLPGGRQRTGVSREGIEVWRLFRRLQWSWAEVGAIHLGMIPAPTGGGFPGVELILADGTRCPIRALGTGRRHRIAITQLIDAARGAGVEVVGSEIVRRHFDMLDVERWGIVETRSGTVEVRPAPLPTRVQLRLQRFVGLTLLLLGMVGTVAFSVIDFVERSRFDDDHVVRAEVVSFKSRSSGRVPSSSVATVRFEVGGSIVESTVRTTRLSVGPTVLVHYDPENPERLRAAESPERRWGWPWVISMTVTVLGGWFVNEDRKEQRALVQGSRR